MFTHLPSAQAAEMIFKITQVIRWTIEAIGF